MEQLKNKVKEYLKEKSIIWSKSTLLSTRSRLHKYINYKITCPYKLLEFYKNQNKQMYSIKTDFICIKKFYDWLNISNEFNTFLVNNKHVFRNSYTDKHTQLTHEIFMEELNRATGELEDALILMGIGGARACELSTFDGLYVIGKGGKKRKLYIPSKYTPKAISMSYKALRDRLRRPCHEYRKLAADKWIRSGIDIKTIQFLLGHISLTSTERYLRPLKDDKINYSIEGIWNEK